MGAASIPSRTHQLALWVPDEDPPAASAKQPEDWTLREFFAEWFRPNHVDSKELGSVLDYDQAIAWWETLTANPPLRAVTQQQATAAKVGLRTAVSVKTGRAISAAYQAKVVRYWRVLFNHAGPRFGRQGAYAGLIAEAPWFDLPSVRKQAKGCWTYQEARAIAAACDRMIRPVVPGSVGDWWRLAVATLYYFGLRDGQMLGLNCGAVRQASDGWRLRVEEVQKTGKYLERRCPGQWLDVYRAVHGDGRPDPESPLLPWLPAARGRARQLSTATVQTQFIRAHGSPRASKAIRRLVKPQRNLQDLAGLPIDRHWEPHAWRRLHVRLRTESGAAAAIAAGSGAAQHGDASVTRDHYYDGDEGTPLVIEARFPLF